MKLPREDELVLCTVEKILPTAVFVTLDRYGVSGLIPGSEVVAGRIQKLGDYVKAGQKIVAKVLKVEKAKAHVELSLRRVTVKEKKTIFEIRKRELTGLAVLKVVVPEKVDSVKRLLSEAGKSVNDLFGELSKNLEAGKRYSLTAEEASRFVSLLRERLTPKPVKVSKQIKLSCESPTGIEAIKELAAETGVRLTYVSAPFYSLTVEGANYAEANKTLQAVLSKLCERASKVGVKAEL